MAKKEKNSNPEVERLLRDLYREDVERVSRGESAVYFGHLNDKPLIDEHPEFDWMTRMVPIPIKRPNTRLSLIDDAVDLYERTNRSGSTLPEINKRVGEFIRGLGDRMPGAIGSAWRGLFDFSQHSPDKGIAGSAFLPMSVIQREENARREANGEYPLGYVSAIDFIWPREKYGTPWDKRTPEEVRQWEIEHGTRNAAEFELPNVDVYPRDSMPKGGSVGKWTDKDEADFRDWYSRVSEYKGLNPDPDDENQYYDYRTFWKENPDGMADRILNDDVEAHFTDRYKLPGHPTFSNESMYSNDETPGGSWEKKEGKWYFTPSDYTRRYIGRTMEYLAGDKENGIYIDGEYRLIPRMDDGDKRNGGKVMSEGGNVGPVKVRGLSARIDTGARPIPVSGNYVEDLRRDVNSDVSEMERLRDIYDYLRNNEKHKFNEIQALAITANIAAESKGRIDALGKAGDFGLQQWLGVRKSELQRRYGKNPSMEQQLDYLIDEYLGSVNGLGWNYTNRGNFYGSDRNGNKYNYYMYSKKEFDDATSYLDATVAWNQGFGRPLGSTLRNNDRRDIAKRLAEAWGVDDGEYKGYIYGMMGDDGKYEYDPERTQPPIETVVPSQGNNRVDSWWDKNGDDFMRSVLSQAGATRDMMKEMMARAEADEASQREIAKQQAEAERDNLRKQVAMSLVQGMRLDIPGMARQS